MNSKLRLLKDTTKKLSILGLTALLIASCGKSSEGDVFGTNNGTSGTSGNTGTTDTSGGVSGQTAQAWQNAKNQYACPGYQTSGRMNDIVFENVYSYGSNYNYNNYNNYYNNQQYSSGGVGIGVDTVTKDLVWVQDNGNGTKRVVLSLCTYHDSYSGMELIGPNSGISNQFQSFSGQVYQSNGCAVGGFSGSSVLYSQMLYQYQYTYIYSQFQAINACN